MKLVTELCKYLEWDSAFFGRRIARASCSRLEKESVQQILSWCADEQIDCLYLLADSDAKETVQLAEKHQFEFVDIRLTLENKPPFQTQHHTESIRSHLPADVPHLKAIARVSHRDSRFYYDSRFPTHLSDQMYETWIEKSCNGSAEQVFVALDNEKPAGYITCHLNASHGEIGLLSVSGSAQGKGLGSKLIQSALGWFAEHNAAEVRVVTQGRNILAQRAYQRHGFLSKSVQLWYHRWF